MELEVGRIIRSSTTRFAVGCQVLRPQVPAFGSLVKVHALGDDEIYGLIHDVRMEDDPFVRQMATTDGLRPEYIEDQRRNRQVPIEVGVHAANLGYLTTKREKLGHILGLDSCPSSSKDSD